MGALNIAKINEAENALRKALISSRVMTRFSDQDNTFWDIAYSPDGKLLAAAGGDGTVKVWDAVDTISKKPILIINAHEDEVLPVAVNP